MDTATPSGALLAPALDAALRRARRCWSSSFDVDAAHFIAFVRERLSNEATGEHVEALHIEDLYLVCACLARDAAAWRELDRTQLAFIPTYVSRFPGPSWFRDEVRQRIAERLVPGPSAKSRLSQYTGRSALGAWFRVAAVREVIDVVRRGRATTSLTEFIVDDVPDAEALCVRRELAGMLEQAIAESVATLSDAQRELLRLHYIEGLSIAEVGAVHRVSRATAARRLAIARALVVERVRETLRDRATPSMSDPSRALAFVGCGLPVGL